MNSENFLSRLKDVIYSLSNGQEDILQDDEIIKICGELKEHEFTINVAKDKLKRCIENSLKKNNPFPNNSFSKDIMQYLHLMGYCMIIDPDTKNFLTNWGVTFPTKNSLLRNPLEEYIDLLQQYHDDKQAFEEDSQGLNHEIFKPYLVHLITHLKKSRAKK